MRLRFWKSQLAFALPTGEARKPVEHPGSRGGVGYFDERAKWRYGERPLEHPAIVDARAAYNLALMGGASEEQLAALKRQSDATRAIHSARFKAWFGDWERDPAAASKVVKPSGEPQETHEIVRVYHGSPKGRDFTAFDPATQDVDALYGPGFYFTEDRDIALGYAAQDAAVKLRGGDEQVKALAAFVRKRLPPGAELVRHRSMIWGLNAGPNRVHASYTIRIPEPDPPEGRYQEKLANSLVPGDVLRWFASSRRTAPAAGGAIQPGAGAPSRFETATVKTVELHQPKAGDVRVTTTDGQTFTYGESFLAEVKGGPPRYVQMDNVLGTDLGGPGAHPDYLPARLGWDAPTRAAWQRHTAAAGWEAPPAADIHECYLNIRKPFNVDTARIPFAALPEPYREAADNCFPPTSREALVERIGDRPLVGQVLESETRRRNEGLTYQNLERLVSWTSGFPTKPRHANPKAEVRALLEKLGYDGLTHIGGKIMGDREHRVWIAFQPTQIKAVANMGSFDPASADIYKGRVLRFGKSQLAFNLEPRKVQHPGVRGGVGWYDEKGDWQYGERPGAPTSGVEWLKRKAQAALAAAEDYLGKIAQDTSRPEERVSKVGKRWEVVSLGTRTPFPSLFDTRKEAVAMAIRNAAVATEMAPERVKEARAIVDSYVEGTVRSPELDRLAARAVSREDLRKQGFVAVTKKGDMHHIGYQIVMWANPHGVTSLNDARVVWEYVPVPPIGKNLPRLTAEGSDQAGEVEAAVGFTPAPLPVEEPPAEQLPLSEAPLELPPGAHDIDGVRTIVRPGSVGDPFKYQSSVHVTMAYDEGGYPAETRKLHAASLVTYRALLASRQPSPNEPATVAEADQTEAEHWRRTRQVRPMASGSGEPGADVTGTRAEREAAAARAAEKRAAAEAAEGQKRAAQLRRAAQGLGAQIAAKQDPAISHQTLTARRANIAGNMFAESQRLERLQKTLLELADWNDRGDLPPVLRGVKTRTLVEDLVNRHTRPPELGMHESHVRDLVRYADKYVPALAGDVAALRAALARDRGGRTWAPLTPDEAAAAERIAASEPPAEAKRWEVPSFGANDAFGDIRRHRRLTAAGLGSPEAFTEAAGLVRDLRGAQRVETPEQKIRKLEMGLVGKQFAGYFPTPRAAADAAVAAAAIAPGMTVLEPSAGKGDMADAIRRAQPEADLTAVERVSDLAAVTAAKGHRTLTTDVFGHTGTYDRVVMNPPFENGEDMHHVRYAYQLLKPGGRLVAIMSEGPFFRSDRKATDFRAWLGEVGGEAEPMPEGSFKHHESSDRVTGVRTRMVVIDKPAAVAPAAPPDWPEVVVHAVRRHRLEGDRGVDWAWFQQAGHEARAAVDRWLVEKQHPLAMEPGTPESRFRRLVHELAVAGAPLVDKPAARPTHLRTVSGREIPVPPTIRLDTNRKATADVRKVDTWLLAEAKAEAVARGDDYNLTMLNGANASRMSQADKDFAHQYLFGHESEAPIAKSHSDVARVNLGERQPRKRGLLGRLLGRFGQKSGEVRKSAGPVGAAARGGAGGGGGGVAASPAEPSKHIGEGPQGGDRDMLATLASDKAALEKDLFYCEHEDLPACPEGDARRPELLKARAQMLGELVALDDALLKARRLHGRRWVDGLHVSVENRTGSVRHWYDPHAERDGTTRMRQPYGYIRRTMGLDGDQVDVFLGPLATARPLDKAALQASTVYIVHTRKPPEFTELDEQKVMLGFPDAAAARAAFQAHYDKPGFFGQMDALPWDDFKAHVRATVHGDPMVRGDVVAHGAIAKARLLLFKAHVTGYQRQGKSGPIEVKEHDDRRPAAQPRVAHPRPPAQTKVGATPTKVGAPAPAPAVPEKPAAGQTAGMAAVHDVPLEQLEAHISSFHPILVKAMTALGRLFPDLPIGGRLKETASLQGKLTDEKKPRTLEQVEDIAGARLTVNSHAEQLSALARIKRMFPGAITTEDDYVTRPKHNYRAIHCIVQVDGKPLEIQVRTPRQTAWADFAHDSVYKTHGKTPPPEVDTYLAQVADHYACLDGGNPPERCGTPPPCPPIVRQEYGCLAAA